MRICVDYFADEESNGKTTLVVDYIDPNVDAIQDTKIKIGRVAEE
jgi:hypothetical protein